MKNTHIRFSDVGIFYSCEFYFFLSLFLTYYHKNIVFDFYYRKIFKIIEKFVLTDYWVVYDMILPSEQFSNTILLQ